MIPVKHIDPDDLALYAMQLLPPDETEEMSEHLQHSSEARRVLAEIYGDLSIFALSAEMQEPSALARQRLMKHVAKEKKEVPVDPLAGAYTPQPVLQMSEARVARKSLAAKTLPWLGWAIAAGMAAFSVSLYQQQNDLKSTLAANQTELQQTQARAALANALMETVKDPSAVHVTLTSSDQNPPPQGRISYVADKGSLILLASNLEKLPPHKTYELWLIPANGEPSIPAGTFSPDEHGFGSVVLPDLAKGVAAKAFGITIENAEGSQTPTLPIVLKGAVS